MGLNPGTGSRIQFQFRRCINLQRKSGGTPNASVHAVYTTITGKKGRTAPTRRHKDKDPEWIENTAIIRDVNPETEFTFIILDLLAPILRPRVLAKSKPYKIGELIQLKSDAEEKSKAIDAETSIAFAVPLSYGNGGPPTAPAGDANSPSLVLTIHDFLDQTELSQHHAKVQEAWTSKNRADLERERASFSEDLKLLSADIPSTANSRTYVDVAAGLFASMDQLFDSEMAVNQRLVLNLVTSYRAAIAQLRPIAHAQSAELAIQFYGKVCLEIARSLRLLEKALTEPGALRENAVIADIDKKTRHFEHYQQNTNNPLDHADLIPKQRASLRRDLIASNPSLASQLSPVFDLEPTRLSRLRARHPSLMIQRISPWVLLSSYANVNRLLWLNGLAGCGKTQLANNLIDAFGRVGASSAYFTFNTDTDMETINKSGEGSGDPPTLTSMARTIAFQLAAYVDGMQPLISSAVRSLSGEPNDHADFATLFDTLIVSPLQTLSRSRKEAVASSPSASLAIPNPIVIILDDLDQCSPLQLDELLPVLSDNLTRLPREARVMLFSRPLAAVTEMFEKNPGTTTVVEYTTTASFSSMNSAGGSSGWAAFAPQTPSRSSSIKWAHATGSSGPPSRRNSAGSVNSGGKRRSGSLGGISEFQIMEVPK